MAKVGEARRLTRRLTALVAGIATVTGWGISGSFAAPTEPTHVSLIVPIVAPIGDGGLLSAEELAVATAEGGEWGILAATARDHRLTVALDSRILASINALGLTAPGEITAWRDDVLATSPLILPWGNADPFVMSQSDAGGTVTAETFAGFANLTPDELVGWPSTGTARADSVARARASGFTALIVDHSTFPSIASGIDTALYSALADAVSPTSTVSTSVAANAITDALYDGAVIALPRDPALMSAHRASRVLSALFSSGVISTGYSPASTLALAETSSPSEPSQNVRDLVAGYESSLTQLGFAAEPKKFITPRAKKFAAVSNISTSPTFADAVTQFAADSGWAASSIFLSLNSSYTVLSNNADVPVNISNNSDSAVTVVVTVRATSAIVQVSQPRQIVTIDARSNVRISVPMTAVANGRTTLLAAISTEEGVAIGDPVILPIEVQAQWELVTVLAFGAGVATIMVIGIGRTIRRRRKTL